MKKIAALFVFAILAVCVLSVTAFAEDYGVYINGEEFTSDNLEIACGSGTAKYDPDTRTLTLEDATIIHEDARNGIRSEGEDIKLVLKGENQIVQLFFGIYAEQNKVEISGEGSLNIFSKYTDGILAGELVVKSGTINVTGDYCGINIGDNMVVDGGAITAAGNNHGISVSGTGKINMNGGSLIAEVKENTASGVKMAVDSVPVVSDSAKYKWRNGSTAAFSEEALPDLSEFEQYDYFEIIVEKGQANYSPYAVVHQITETENPALSEEENPDTGADYASILCAGAIIVLAGTAALLKGKKH